MKMIHAFAVLGLLASGFAVAASDAVVSDVVLNSDSVSISADTATVIRNSSTPRKVDVQMQIPMSMRVCEETQVQTVFSQDPVCGYDNVPRTVWETVCVRYEGGRCTRYEQRPVTVWDQVMRSCYHPVTVCIRYGTRVQMEMHKVELVFKKAASLDGAEQETFTLHGNQDSYDSPHTDFALSAISTKVPYTIKDGGFFSGNKIKVERQ